MDQNPMTNIVLPTAEQEQRAKWDLLLTDIELKQEQLRHLRTFEGWKLAFAGMTSGAALMAAGVGLAALLLRMIH
jgi:hypothetical protein